MVECGFLMDMDNYECVFHSSFGWIVRAGSRSVSYSSPIVMREMEGVRCDELSVQGFMGIKAIR